MGACRTGPVLLVVLLTTIARADPEKFNITPEQFDAAPKWEPDAQAYGEMPRVDLRRELPSIGAQGRQYSCVGWAVAYACKSYLEVKDQGWRADAPARLFSPAFVYNQLNGGVDRGSNIQRALELLKRQGCATLATMPYGEADFRTQPGPRARAEAARFRCRGYYAVRNGALIRKAIQQGHVVILGIRTDPVFLSGHFPVFTAAERRRGDALRNPDSPHGYHAICVVGYDDTRRAFLLMNSWGRTWGKQGYCWVHYDMMRTVYPHPDNLVQQAWVLLDVQQRVGGETTPPPAIDKRVEIRGHASYAGYRDSRHAWAWRTSIGGSAQALQGIDRVVWRVPQAGGRVQAFASTASQHGFQVGAGATGLGLFEVAADVRFKDGTNKPLSFKFNFTRPRRRRLDLVQTDRYWGKLGGRSQWEWTLQLRGGLVDLADVRQVTYHLHPSFPDPNPVVAASAANGYAYTTRGWGSFVAKATVLFHDGSMEVLQTELQFKDAARDTLTLRNTSRKVAWHEGRQYYNWAAFVDGPLALLRRIRFVRYRLHPTFLPNIRDVSWGREYGFPLATNGWGEFKLKATVHLDDGTAIQLVHDLELR